MKTYLKLLRVKHYIKNILIFIPLFFSRTFFVKPKLLSAAIGFLAFSFICSAVYIINDLRDLEKDKSHPVKRNRPIASGAVTPIKAIVVLTVCIILSGILNWSISKSGNLSFIFLIVYFLINLGYSVGLKDKPIIDVVILTAGFIIRVVYGAFITDINISGWLYLTVFAGAFFLGLGKRRNEIKKLGTVGNTRPVLKYYSYEFLDRNMYVCVALADTFYALWALETNNPYMVWTVPLVIIILLKYSLDIENDEGNGDPVEVVLGDKVLIILCLLLALIMLAVLYFI